MFRAKCKICGTAFEGEDYKFIADQIVAHYRGSHGTDVAVVDFLGPAPKKVKAKVSKAETMDTYPMEVEDVNAPAPKKEEKVAKKSKPAKKTSKKSKKNKKSKKK